MSESFLPGGEVLPPSLGRRIDQACDHFEAAWRAGTAPVIENALDGWAEPDRAALAQELILLDLYYRRCSGASPLAEDYLRRFPSLDRTWLADVIAAEVTPSGVNASPITTILPSSAEVTKNCRGAYNFLGPPLNPGDLGRLGPYDVLKVMGAGGMGVVFQAYDPQLERWVALKAMLPGLGVSASARQRFLREAKATAAIKHDHIVTIYQVGEDRGVPFLAMEYLEGEPLDARLRREAGGQGAFPLPLRETLRICREIAEGLDAAHQRGLIHRDVKPANIWLEGERRRVKILDFGLALVSADANGPEPNAVVGAPAYMAPEQIAGQAVDGRADLFSLGCIFYRMATGEPPFQGNGAVSAFLSASTESLSCPREWDASLPVAVRDLLVHLLAKRREDRPASARAVVAAQQAAEKNLANSYGDKDGSFRLTRKRVWPWLAAAILLALMIWRFGPSAMQYGADKREPVAETNNPAVVEQTSGSAETAKWRFDDTLYDQMSKEAAEKALRKVLEEEAAPNADMDQLRIAAAEFRRKQAGTPQALTAAKLLQRLPSPLDVLSRERISPYELASAGGGNPLATPQELTAIFGDSRLHHAYWADVVVFHPAGKQVFSGSHDGTVKVWRVSSGEAQGTMHWGTIAFPALSPDGRTLAVCGDRPEVQLWDLTTGKQGLTLRGHGDGVIDAATFSHDGKTLATASTDGSVKLWNPATGVVRKSLPGRKGWFQTLVFSPDDKSLVGAVKEVHTVLTWDVAEGELRAGRSTEGYVVAISPDGKQWAVRYDDAFWVKVVEASTDKQVRVLNELTRTTRCAAFSPDGRRLATGGRSAELKVWDLSTGKVVHDLQSYSYECSILSVAFSADGSMLASAGDDGRVRLWDMKAGKEVVPLKTTYEIRATVGPDGRRLATTDGNQIRILDMATGTESQKLVGTDFTGQLALTPDGRSLLALNWYGPIDLWNLATAQPQRLSDHAGAFPHALAITPDGTLAASGDQKTTQIKVWDLAAKRQLRTLNHIDYCTSLDNFSLDESIAGRRCKEQRGQGLVCRRRPPTMRPDRRSGRILPRRIVGGGGRGGRNTLRTGFVEGDSSAPPQDRRTLRTHFSRR